MSAFFASLAFKLLAPALLVALLAAAYLGWESRVQRAALIEAQRDQLVKVIAERDQARREQAETNQRFLDLPDVRQRLCAIQGPASGCCRPAPAECAP